MSTPRSAFGASPQGAPAVARLSRFHAGCLNFHLHLLLGRGLFAAFPI
jgi:hypothetical protein